MDDPFVQSYDADDLAIAAEFLTNWLPFLTRGLCHDCAHHLRDRIQSLQLDPASPSRDPEPSGVTEAGDPPDQSPDPSPSPHWSEHVEPSGWDTSPPSSSPKVRMSWADMAQEDELEEEEEEEASRKNFAEEEEGGEGAKGEGKKKTELSREQREQIRFKNVGRKKDFICLERVKGKIVNILDGLELHTGVFSMVEQKRIVDFVYELQEKGRNNQLGEQTYSEPTKWMRGKGRVTIQFGCCYNYAMDKNGNPPGILRAVVADPIPHLFKVIIRRLIRWHVLPASCVPDSCIVNIYEPGDCIPPHIDNHDFVRPFCTVSFLSECNIVFGSNLKVVGAGDFTGSTAIPLPVGSVLVLNGNGADVAKHCVPAVPTKRISITFRKMDEAKQPFGFQPEPDLQNIQLLPYGLGGTESQHQTRNKQSAADSKSLHKGRKSRGKPHGIGAKPELDFQDNRHYLGDTETPLTRLPRQVIDARSASSGDFSERGKRASGRPSEQKHFQDDGEDGPMRRWRQQSAAVEDGSNFEGSKELGGRRVILDQRRIIISRNMEGEGEHLLTGSRNSEPSHLSQIQIRPPNNGRRRVRVSLSDD